MAERIGILIRAEDFAAFRKLMPTEVRLGKTYEEWKKRRHGEDMLATGGVQRVTVRPEEFAAYCAQIRRKPTYYALEAFAVKKGLDGT
jgi:hypothetical protein